jgi:hypothetical protein
MVCVEAMSATNKVLRVSKLRLEVLDLLAQLAYECHVGVLVDLGRVHDAAGLRGISVRELLFGCTEDTPQSAQRFIVVV